MKNPHLKALTEAMDPPLSDSIEEISARQQGAIDQRQKLLAKQAELEDKQLDIEDPYSAAGEREYDRLDKEIAQVKRDLKAFYRKYETVEEAGNGLFNVYRHAVGSSAASGMHKKQLSLSAAKQEAEKMAKVQQGFVYIVSPDGGGNDMLDPHCYYFKTKAGKLIHKEGSPFDYGDMKRGWDESVNEERDRTDLAATEKEALKYARQDQKPMHILKTKKGTYTIVGDAHVDHHRKSGCQLVKTIRPQDQKNEANVDQKTPSKSGDEMDVVSKAPLKYLDRAGVKAKAKKALNKRGRQDAKRDTQDRFHEAFEKPEYADHFKAGFEAGKAEFARNNRADKSDADKQYRKVSKQYGSYWVDGFCAAIDLSRGAYATEPAKQAKSMGLKENKTGTVKCDGKSFKYTKIHLPHAAAGNAVEEYELRGPRGGRSILMKHKKGFWILQPLGAMRPVSPSHPESVIFEASSSTPFKCEECGAKFKKKLGPNTIEVECPKCHSIDVMPTDFFGEARSHCRNCGKSTDAEELRQGNCRKCTAEIELGDKLPGKDVRESVTINPARLASGGPSTYCGKTADGKAVMVRSSERKTSNAFSVDVGGKIVASKVGRKEAARIAGEHSVKAPWNESIAEATGVVDVDMLRRECNDIIRKEGLDGQRSPEQRFDADVMSRLQTESPVSESSTDQYLKDLSLSPATRQFKDALHALRRDLDKLSPEQKKMVSAALARCIDTYGSI
jgi:Zn finger protein HypA/HybF involved in hydrogenase expression